MANLQIAIARKSIEKPFCGDQGGFWQEDANLTLCLVDGLGHGRDAEFAANKAIEYVEGHFTESMENIFAGCNKALYHTRGAAMGIAVIHRETSSLTYAGIGNIEVVVVNTNTIHLASNYGIVGGDYRRLSPQRIQLCPETLVIMHTDGIRRILDLTHYKPKFYSDIQKLADRILKDWSKEDDDAGVLVYKYEGKLE